MSGSKVLHYTMQDYTWFDPQARLVQMLRSGRGMGRDALVIINGQAQAQQITLPWGRGTDFELMWPANGNARSTTLSILHPAGISPLLRSQLQDC